MNSARVGIAAAALAVVGGIAIFLFSGDDDAERIDVPQRQAATPRALDDAPLASEATPVDAARAAVADVQPRAPDEPPAEYVAALGAITGRVVETDGTPVPDMKIELLGAALPDILIPVDTWFQAEPIEFKDLKATTRTDEAGRFAFTKLEPDSVLFLGCDLEGPRAKIQFVDRTPNPGETVDVGDVRLEPYVTFTGRVVDERGDPVAFARVRATNLPSIIFNFGAQWIGPGFAAAFKQPPGDQWRVLQWSWLSQLMSRLPVPQTETDAEGAFRLEGVPLGSVSVVVDRPHFVPLVHGPVPANAQTPERDVGRLVLDRGESLEGVVIGQDGKPLAGARIFAGPQFEIFPAAVMMPLATSNADGTFVADGLSDANHVIAAQHPNGGDWAVLADQVPGADEPELKFGATESLTVTARNGAGEIITKPNLVIQPLSEVPLHPLLTPPIPLGPRLRYLEDGTASVSGLAPGRYSILVRAQGYAVGKDSADLSKGKAHVDVTLEPEYSASITVLAAGTKAPIVWAAAGAFDTKNAQRELRRVPLVVRKSDDAGQIVLPGLKAGEYKVRVSHPAYANVDLDLTVPGDPLLATLTKGGTLVGRVHMAGDPPDKARFIGMGLPREGELPTFSVTDGNGDFTITHLAPGNYEMVVLKRFADQGMSEFMQGMESMIPERFVSVTIKEGETTKVDVDLLNNAPDGPAGTLRGRVSIDGQLAQNASVTAMPEGDWRAMRTISTDQYGVYDFGKVKAGKVRVSIRKRGMRSMMMMGGGGELATQSIDVPANEIVELNFDVKTGRVRGSVRSAQDGQPLLAAEVRLQPQEAAAPSTGAAPRAEEPRRGPPRGNTLRVVTERDGSFVFEAVPEGTYTLTARREGYAAATVRDVVVPYGGEPNPVDVRLVTGVAVKGRVDLPSGTAAPQFLFLEFRAKDDSSRRSGGRVDTTSMEFRVDNLFPGTYEVRYFGRDLNLEPSSIDVPVSGLIGAVLSPMPRKS